MLVKLRNYLNTELQEGLLIPRISQLLEFLYKKCSLFYRINCWFKNESKEKGPPGVSELCQVISILIGLFWIALINVKFSIFSTAPIRYIGASFALYRIFELLYFLFIGHLLLRAECMLFADHLLCSS